MGVAKHTYEECLEQMKRYEAMGFGAQAEVWRKKSEEVKREEGEKRMRVWKRKMGVRLEGSGVSFTEWMEWAKSQYRVIEEDGIVKVLSSCSNKEWEFEYEVDGLEKVWQLIGYKEYDRGRGRGSMEEDMNG